MLSQTKTFPAELNLLRYPVFALRGGLTVSAIRSEGVHPDSGARWGLTASRKALTAYPGPLSRSVHMALVSLLADRGEPFGAEVTWTWRQLADRVGGRAYCGGNQVRRLKEAIRATAGLRLASTGAIYDAAGGRWVTTDEQGMHLYEGYAFSGENGSDSNRVAFSQWYVSNLNLLYTRPLDYELWRRIDVRSSLGSRLYEFLLYGYKHPDINIEYAKLAGHMPVSSHRHLSRARHQFATAFRLLAEHGVLRSPPTWEQRDDGRIFLTMARGPKARLAGGEVSKSRPDTEEPAGGPEARSERVRVIDDPARRLVTDWYEHWANRKGVAPSANELRYAQALIDQHGADGAGKIVTGTIEVMRRKWPDAKRFISLQQYLPEVAEAQARAQKAKQNTERQKARREAEGQDADRERAELERWRPVWGSLPEQERQEIEQTVKARSPFGPTMPTAFHLLCLGELARRRSNIPLTADEPF